MNPSNRTITSSMTLLNKNEQIGKKNPSNRDVTGTTASPHGLGIPRQDERAWSRYQRIRSIQITVRFLTNDLKSFFMFFLHHHNILSQSKPNPGQMFITAMVRKYVRDLEHLKTALIAWQQNHSVHRITLLKPEEINETDQMFKRVLIDPSKYSPTLVRRLLLLLERLCQSVNFNLTQQNQGTAQVAQRKDVFDLSFDLGRAYMHRHFESIKTPEQIGAYLMAIDLIVSQIKMRDDLGLLRRFSELTEEGVIVSELKDIFLCQKKLWDDGQRSKMADDNKITTQSLYLLTISQMLQLMQYKHLQAIMLITSMLKLLSDPLQCIDLELDHQYVKVDIQRFLQQNSSLYADAYEHFQLTSFQIKPVLLHVLKKLKENFNMKSRKYGREVLRQILTFGIDAPENDRIISEITEDLMKYHTERQIMEKQQPIRRTFEPSFQGLLQCATELLKEHQTVLQHVLEVCREFQTSIKEWHIESKGISITRQDGALVMVLYASPHTLPVYLLRLKDKQFKVNNLREAFIIP